MKFKKWLTEEDNINDVIEDIEDSCQPYLKDLQSIKRSPGLLFSGRNSRENFIKNRIRKNRRPKDMPEEIHDLLNDKFKEKFGINLRSETLFCYPDAEPTAEFGSVYIIFPIGKYQIYWSPSVQDLFRNLADRVGWNTLDDFEGDEQKTIDTIENVVSTYQKGNLKKALSSNVVTEIMLHCNEYIGVSYKYIEEILLFLRDNYDFYKTNY